MQCEDEERQFLLSESNRNTLSAEEKAVLRTPNVTATPGEELPKEVIHKVVYGDTLEGLSLEYSVQFNLGRCPLAGSNTEIILTAIISTTSKKSSSPILKPSLFPGSEPKRYSSKSLWRT
jgi:hypothetical protein